MVAEKIQTIVIYLAWLIAFTFAGCARGGPGAISDRTEDEAVPNALEKILNNMVLPHKGLPHGMRSSWTWASGPGLGAGNDSPENCIAMTAWGKVYEDSEGNSSRNTRVQIRNLKAYQLGRSSREWRLIQDSNVVE